MRECAQLEAAVSAAKSAAAAAAAEEGGDAFSYRAFYAGYVDPHRIGGWRRDRRNHLPLCYICELDCDFDDHGTRFCKMCWQDHHLACDVDPSSAKVAEECNLMLAEDRPTGGWDPRLDAILCKGITAAREVELRACVADYRQNGIRDSSKWPRMVKKWRPSLESMSCDLAKNAWEARTADDWKRDGRGTGWWATPGEGRARSWLCSSCQQKQAASNTGLCYSRSNIEF